MMLSGKDRRATHDRILLVSLCVLAIAGLASALLRLMMPSITLADGDSVSAIKAALPAFTYEWAFADWLVSFLLIYVGIWLFERAPGDDGDDNAPAVSGLLGFTGFFCCMTAVLALVGGWLNGIAFGLATYAIVLVLSVSAASAAAIVYLCAKWVTYPVRYCWQRWGRPGVLGTFAARLRRYFEGDAF